MEEEEEKRKRGKWLGHCLLVIRIPDMTLALGLLSFFSFLVQSPTVDYARLVKRARGAAAACSELDYFLQGKNKG